MPKPTLKEPLEWNLYKANKKTGEISLAHEEWTPMTAKEAETCRRAYRGSVSEARYTYFAARISEFPHLKR